MNIILLYVYVSGGYDHGMSAAFQANSWWSCEVDVRCSDSFHVVAGRFMRRIGAQRVRWLGLDVARVLEHAYAPVLGVIQCVQADVR